VKTSQKFLRKNHRILGRPPKLHYKKKRKKMIIIQVSITTIEKYSLRREYTLINDNNELRKLEKYYKKYH
jgi:hypothetical protein